MSTPVAQNSAINMVDKPMVSPRRIQSKKVVKKSNDIYVQSEGKEGKESRNPICSSDSVSSLGGKILGKG